MRTPSSSGLIAALALFLVLLSGAAPVLAQPLPTNYAASVSYNPFFSTTPTWYPVSTSTTKVTTVPWAVELSNYIAYNTTSTKSTNVALCTAQATTNECITLDFYNTHTTSSVNLHIGDIVYTDPTGSSFLIGHFNFTTGSNVANPSVLNVEMADNGQVYVYDNNATYINGFIATPYTVNYIGASGNVLSPSGKNYEATGGYLSIFVGGTAGIQQTSNVIIQIVPLVVVVGILGVVISMFKKFKF
jgi:hypothetical protein